MLRWCVKKHETFKTVGVDAALNRGGETDVTLLNFHGQNMTFTESGEKYRENSDWQNKSYTKSFWGEINAVKSNKIFPRKNSLL